MRVALIIGSGVPNPTTGGGALTAYTVLRHLLDEGHEVAVVGVFEQDYYDPAGATAAARIAHLRELGADVVPVPSAAPDVLNRAPTDLRSRAHRAWRPSDEELYPYLVDAERVRDAVADLGVDVAFVYHFEGLAASRLVDVPRLAAVGDPSHLPSLYRFRDARPRVAALRQVPRLQAILRHQPRLMATLMRECAAAGAFAGHHAAWLREHGVPGCEYLRTPVPDAGGLDWRARRDAASDPERPHILLLGHLRGIVTIDGLRVFAKMLPALERELGPDGFVVDVVGGYEPPAELSEALSHPAVRRHGHAEQDEAEEWLQRADVLLVPTSIPLGIRVRILTGFAAGSCIVAHRANALGIPELVHDRNALLGSSPEELAAAVALAVRDGARRRRIDAEARATWERAFSPPVAAGRIAEVLTRIARPVQVPTR